MEDKNYFKQFDIQFGNLNLGKYRSDLEVNCSFFEKHSNEDVIDANIAIQLDIERKETLIILHFNMEGTLYSNCDLCLEKISIPVHHSESLILKIVPNPHESDDENIVFINENVYSYNVEQIIFEYLYALLPIRKVHGEIGPQTCNQNMLSLIEKAKAKPLKQVDARWDALKSIKLEDN